MPKEETQQALDEAKENQQESNETVAELEVQAAEENLEEVQNKEETPADDSSETPSDELY